MEKNNFLVICQVQEVLMVVICVLLVVVFGSLSRRTFAKVRNTPST